MVGSDKGAGDGLEDQWQNYLDQQQQLEHHMSSSDFSPKLAELPSPRARPPLSSPLPHAALDDDGLYLLLWKVSILTNDLYSSTIIHRFWLLCTTMKHTLRELAHTQSYYSHA